MFPLQSIKSNLPSTIVNAVPDYICKLPKVTYRKRDSGESVVMGLPILLSNMRAINEAWQLARSIGSAGVKFDPELMTLRVRPWVYKNSGKLEGSYNSSRVVKVDKKGGINEINYSLCDDDRWQLLFGNKYPGFDFGYPILSSDLEELICDYTSVVRNAAKKVSLSYGVMVSLGGINTNDVPLMHEVQDKTLNDWEKYKLLMATEGTKIDSVTSSISDIERILIPFQEAIATESGVPLWLLFPNKTASSFELEEREAWGAQLFHKHVSPVLLGLLAQQGFEVVGLETPNYRDKQAEATLQQTVSDSKYKDSATEKNSSSIKVSESGLKLQKELQRHQIEMDKQNSSSDGQSSNKVTTTSKVNKKPPIKDGGNRPGKVL